MSASEKTSRVRSNAPAAGSSGNRLSRLAELARRLFHNESGVAAVEFGFLVPILLLMFICTIEVSRMVAIDRRVQLATAMVADLVSREKSIAAVDLKGTTGNANSGIYGIVRHVMSPYDTDKLTIAITPVQSNPDDKDDIRVYAATTNRPPYNNGKNKAKGVRYPLEEGLIAPGASAIVVEATYTYEPIFLTYLTTVLGWRNVPWQEKAIMSPRENCVDFDANKCVTSIF